MKKLKQKIGSWIFDLRYYTEEFQLSRIGKILLLMFVVWIVGANLIYTTEQLYHQDGIPWTNEHFKNYSNVYWDVIVYLTSGVEDYVPDSPYSKVITFTLLIAGIVIIGIFTANLVPVMIKVIHDKDYIKQKPLRIEFTNHYIICGNSRKLTGIIDQLSYYANKYNNPILIISNKAKSTPKICTKKYKNVWGIEGDPTSDAILAKANVNKAKSIILLTDDTQEPHQQADAELINISYKLYNNHTIVEINNLAYIPHLVRANVNLIIDPKEYSYRLIAQSALTPGLSFVYHELLSASQNSSKMCFMPVKKLAELYGKDIVGRSYREIVQLHLSGNIDDFIIIGYQVVFSDKSAEHIGRGDNDSTNNIDRINPSINENKYNQDFKLNSLDNLIVIAYDEAQTKASRIKETGMEYNKNTDIYKNHLIDKSINLGNNKGVIRNHIVICNWSDKARKIIRELHSSNIADPAPVVIITDQFQVIKEQEDINISSEEWMKDVYFLPGSPLDSNVLYRAGLEHASTAIILYDPRDKEYGDAKSVVIALAIEAIDRRVHTIVEILNSKNKEYFKNTHVDEIICVEELSEKLLAQAALTHNISELYLHLLTESEDTNEVYILPIPSNYIGRSWEDMEQALFKYIHEDVVLIGFITQEKKRINERTVYNHFGNLINVNKLYINPKKNPRHNEKGKKYLFRESDQIVVIAYHKPNLESLT